LTKSKLCHNLLVRRLPLAGKNCVNDGFKSLKQVSLLSFIIYTDQHLQWADLCYWLVKVVWTMASKYSLLLLQFLWSK